MSTVWNLAVELDGGQDYKVTADQRDLAQFEVHPDGCSFFEYQTRPITFLRFLAWNAGRRQKLHELTWEQFRDECVAVTDLDEGEGAQEADPGHPAASAGN